MAQAFGGTQLGWIAARWTDGRALFQTADGGRKWTALDLPAEVTYAAELQFVDAQNGWLLGFANRGIQSVGCDAAAPANSPRCRDILFRTRDGGRSWTSVRVMSIAPAGGSAIKDVQFVDATTGWILERNRPAPCETASRASTSSRQRTAVTRGEPCSPTRRCRICTLSIGPTAGVSSEPTRMAPTLTRWPLRTAA